MIFKPYGKDSTINLGEVFTTGNTKMCDVTGKVMIEVKDTENKLHYAYKDELINK